MVVAARGSANVLGPALEALAREGPVVVPLVGAMNARPVAVATKDQPVEPVMNVVVIAAVATIGVRPRVMRARRDGSSVTSSPGRVSSGRLPSGLRRISATRTKARARTVTIATSTA